ncbi:O-acetylhomoserine aminocarboxypropyltransferase/cysteine synthase family protein [Microbacterium album]|uniref:homocysteine desulfhydrase n=1 Tax=Microbacterium album TaxID=2053191 RepID=A0A917IEX7_9MICO|nr:PLP-dependent transferase [Microbacterium album]GGH42990.1 O-acetylhomoserine (thiol)-lyase [Microbacterium album]
MTSSPAPSSPAPGAPAHRIAPPTYEWDGFGFDTRQVHVGDTDQHGYQARVAPIYLTAGYRFDSFRQSWDRFTGDEPGQLYSRNLNPTHLVAEQRIASLEGGAGAIVVGSGQAAITSAILGLTGAGEHFVSTASIYSGTQILFNRTFSRLGVAVDYVWDWTDDAEWDALIRPETKAIFTETIPNPKNDIVDIAAVARVAQRHGLPLIVDNTIASPYLTRPIEDGAHIVVHSSTKFLAGHGAGLSGVIVDGGTFDWAAASRPYPGITDAPAPGRPSMLEAYGRHALEAYLRLGIVNDMGPALSPLNSFLLQQGIETLSLRVERHVDNAHRIALWLQEQPEVARVDYAGLPSSPYYEIAQRVYGGRSGSVFAFSLAGGRAAAELFYDSLRVFSRMTNIGDVRSMALHPATTTHVSFTQDIRDRLGIDDGLIRLSIGIETADDLIADLRRAFDAVSEAGL